MQLLAKFKKILDMEFRATLNFRKFKVALHPMYRIFLNFAKSCILPFLPKFDETKWCKRHLKGFAFVSAGRCLLHSPLSFSTGLLFVFCSFGCSLFGFLLGFRNSN